MGRNYPRMNIVDFGKHLLDSEDLDPIYVALAKLRQKHVWDDSKVQRWLIAYWCFYNAGVASHLSEFGGGQFWDRMMVAATNEEETPIGTRWPRGSERRHFRGQQAIKAVTELREKYPDVPERMAIYCTGWGGPKLPFREVSNRVQAHRGFGPWIAFKVADMADRVCGTDVDFDEAAVFMFKDPVQAALRLWREHTKVPDNAQPKSVERVINQVLAYLEEHLGDRLAPPLYDRKLNLQEYETILCKWKSHMNGHYPMFNDITEIREGLTPWADCPPAQDFLREMPKGQDS